MPIILRIFDYVNSYNVKLLLNVIFYSLENIDTFHYESLTQRILSSEYTKAMINLGEKQCDLYQQTIDANDAKMNFFR